MEKWEGIKKDLTYLENGSGWVIERNTKPFWSSRGSRWEQKAKCHLDDQRAREEQECCSERGTRDRRKEN